MKNIAIFFGGESVEHDVSIITGVLTLNSLDKEKYNPFPVYVAKNGIWYTGEKLFDIENYKEIDYKKLKTITLTCGSPVFYEVKGGKKLKPIFTVSCAVNCMHGERGEDGALSGLLSMCKIPIASPGIIPSAICIDKRISKILLKGLAVKTPPAVRIKKGILPKGMTFPVVVKPNKLGSSIGISVANDNKELKSAVNLALRYGDEVIAEEKLADFIEINCAAYVDKDGNVVVSECEKPIGKNDLLTFADKYTGGEREYPANIDAKISDKIKWITEKVYSALNMKGIIRIDYFVKGDEVMVNEINTVPGSLAYYFFCDTIKEFGKLLEEQVEIAERNFAKENTFIKTYDSKVLFIEGAKGSKRL